MSIWTKQTPQQYSHLIACNCVKCNTNDLTKDSLVQLIVVVFSLDSHATCMNCFVSSQVQNFMVS
jgi:hypothetical protein